ncbi:MAG: protein phosphatase 2C domain-containing protein [Beutenbergiaceae bacterium]
MDVSFRCAVRSDLGTVRTNNEDSALAGSHILVLADGMGGHAAGEVASTVASRMFAAIDDGDADVPAQLTQAGRATRAALAQMSAADPFLDSMGTTLLTVVSHAEGVTVGHIGDSRVYALRGSELFQVTTDHTHVQQLVDTGQLTAEQARTHPYRSMLLRSLDDQSNGPDVDIIELELEPGDRLLLCSDGLSDYVLPAELGQALSTEDRDAAADELVQAALQAGTRDNVTVVVADVVTELGTDESHAAGAVEDPLELSASAAAALLDSFPSLAPFLQVKPEPENDPDADHGPDTDDDLADESLGESDAAEPDIPEPDTPEPEAGAAPAEPVEAHRRPDPPGGSQTPAAEPATTANPAAVLLSTGLLLAVAVAIWFIL